MPTASPVRLALIGAGYHARHDHLPALRQVEEAKPGSVAVLAVVDPDEARGKALAEEAGAAWCPAHADLPPGELDAACCLTPHHLTIPIARELCAAGLAVLVEKPMGVDLAEAEAFAREAAEGGWRTAISMNRRYDPFLAKAKRLLGDRRIRHARAMVLREGREPAGFVMDVGPHAVDVLDWFCGPLEAVSASTSAAGAVHADLRGAGADAVMLDLHPAAGVVAETYEFIGDDYRVEVEARTRCQVHGEGLAITERHRRMKSDEVRNGTFDETLAFLAAVRGEGPFWPGPHHVLRGSRALCAVRDLLRA